MVTLVNRAKMATSTTGTGTITLGSAVTGFQTFADAGITNGMTVRYVIENGDNFEIGSGTYTASGTTLSRTVSESSNSNNALNLSGSSEVFLTAIAADIDAKLDKSGGTMTGVLAMGSNAITTSSTVDGRDLSADGTKLDAIEASATADQTASEIRALVESASDSNVFTDADHSKLNAIEASATADQTDAEIRAAVEAASDSNVFTDADHSKLNGIEASADVTDTTNVTAAGALMDSEVTNLAEVKAFDSSDYATAAQGTLATNALPKGGGTMTGDLILGDNVKIEVGSASGGDLQIFHDGSNNYVDAAGVGHLYLRSQGDDKDVKIQSDNGSGGLTEYFRADGSLGQAQMFHYGTKKLNTTTTGISVTNDIAVSGTVDGRDIATDGTKLDGIEANATADQTAAEIRTLVESATDSNVFTDADHTKLNGIESNATADQTDAEIRAAVEAASDSNVFTDADHTKLNGIESNATADQTNAEIRAAVEAASDSNVFTDADHTKLNGIEASADVTDTANVVAALSAGTGVAISGAGEITVTAVALTTVQTASSQSAHLALTAQEGDVVVRSDENKSYMHNGGTAGTMSDYTLLATPTDAVLSVNGNTGAISAAQIATAVEAASDSNTFTDADHSKLNGIEASATADQTAAEIRTLVESASDSNVFTDADHSKLNGIEASADVTDATNVTAAGALMDSEVTNLAQVKAFDSSDYATAAQGTTADAALPKSGGAMTGALSSNSNITTSGNLGVGSATGTINGIHVKSNGTDVIMNETVGSSAIRILGAGGLNYIQSGTSTSSSNAPIVFTAMNGGTEYARIESGETKVTGNIVVTGTVDGRDVATDGTKLDTIETNADVTDTANVTSAGALMDSECASLADVKALNQSLVTTATPTFARLKLTQTTVAANSSATTLDFSAANNFLVNMSADTTFTWSNLSGAVGCSGNIVLVQDATGGRDFTLPSQAKKPINGATIVQNTGANEISVLSYYVMSSSQVLVNYIGDFA